MNKEIWKPIKEYEGLYEVSNLGRVKRVGKSTNKTQADGGLMKLRIEKQGYLRVQLSKNNYRIKYSVHRLVAITFLPNLKNKPEVNHIDNNRINNEVNNLEWVTQKENQQHSVHQDRHSRGERHGNSKLTDKAVREIRKSKLTLSALGKIYGVNLTKIHAVKKYQTWKHIL